MAKNKAKMNKFITGAVTATMVATAVVPVAAAAETTKKFSDVAATDSHYQNIMGAVERGLFNGYADGTFKPYQDLKRSQVAKILANYVVGQEDLTYAEYIEKYDLATNVEAFNDVTEDHSDKELFNASLIVKHSEIFTGSNNNLMPNIVINRQQMAKVLVNAFGLEDLEGDLSKVKDADKAYAEFRPYIHILSENGVTTTENFNPLEPVKRAQMASFLNRAYDVANPVAVDPKIVSVSATNLKEIEVKFNVAINDANLAESLTAVGATANLLDVAETYLSADGKTLTLVAENPLTNDTFYNLSLSGLLTDGQLEPLAPYSTSIKVSDKKAPVVSKVTSVTKDAETDTLTVEFSEPVYLDLVKVGDVVASANATDGTLKTYTVQLPASADKLEVGKAYTITLNGLRDLAENFAPNPTTTTVTVVRDAERPTFVLSALNPKQFNIVFNESVLPSSIDVDSIIVKNADGDILPQANLATRLGDGKTVRVTLFDTPIASGKTSAEVSVSVKSITDLAGNAVSAKTEKVTLVKETVPPTITAVRVLPGTNNKVEVTFSERVTGVDNTDFALTNPNGGNVVLDAFTNQTTDANNKVVLTTTNPLPGNGEYNLAIYVNSVEDTSFNKNAAKALKFNYNGVTAPAVSATITSDLNGNATVDAGDTDSSNQQVIIHFSQNDIVNGKSASTGDFKTGAADNLANYTLNGAALPAGTTVTFTESDAGGAFNKDYVTIDFSGVSESTKATALKNGGEIVITASNVRTIAGSTIPYTSAKITVADVTAPTISSAYLRGTELTVFFSEAMFTVDKDDFVLTDGTETATLSAATVSGNKATFTVTIGDLDVKKLLTFKTANTVGTGTQDNSAANNPIAVDETGVRAIYYAN